MPPSPPAIRLLVSKSESPSRTVEFVPLLGELFPDLRIRRGTSPVIRMTRFRLLSCSLTSAGVNRRYWHLVQRETVTQEIACDSRQQDALVDTRHGQALVCR